MIQVVDYQLKVLAYIIPAGPLPDKTIFLTAEDCTQQVGYIVYPKGGRVARHYHLPVERHFTGTTEILLVLKGQCQVDFYDDDKNYLISKELKTGDLIIIVAGGHGFQMLQDTVLLEVKQGPYPGVWEKEKF
jgi:quercetin dioxygenase-like cupin family protein